MTGNGIGEEAGARGARARALAVLRVRSRALAVALLPAAVAVVLLAGGWTEHLVGPFWHTARWVMTPLAVLVLLAAGAVGLVVARARPAVSPTVAIPEESAPDLYRMVRDLADRLDVPAPSAIALTPDCDSWLEDRTHPSHGTPPTEERDEIAGARAAHRRTAVAPVLVIGSPFLWWMRVGELRAVLAPVVAGTGPSAHPDIAAARRFVRGLDAAVAVAATPGRRTLTRPVRAGVGWSARLLLRACREHAAQMERGVAAAAAERAQAVDYGLRIVAQEQVGLAYAGWDRLLTRVALPAWRMGRWPSRLDAGVVAALTELSRRDRLAEGFASRLGERPACDLLDEPGVIDEATSLLAARLFHGGPAEPGPDWAPVDWEEYPEEVVDRKWRTDAARLHRVLDTLATHDTFAPPETPTSHDALTSHDRPTPHGAPTSHGALTPHDTFAGHDAPAPIASRPAQGPTLSRVLDHLTLPQPMPRTPIPENTHPADGTASGGPTPGETTGTETTRTESTRTDSAPATNNPTDTARTANGPTENVPTGIARTDGASTANRPTDTAHGGTPHGGTPHGGTPHSETAHGETAPTPHEHPQPPHSPHEPTPHDPHTPHDPAESNLFPEEEAVPRNERGAVLAARLTTELAREEATAGGGAGSATGRPEATPDAALWDDGGLPLFPLQPPRTARELLADHVTAMVCCAAMDTAGAAPGLDWLDGPSLLFGGERTKDLAPRVLSLVEDGDPAPLRAWLAASGIRAEKPVRLV
ncbi:hypothetical protein [Streptomyces griseoviridis]|uniref:hypothetical protein n=1 Tax=Streptomyces griseoviridis TaxID=45398 RepID=UPI0034549043